MLLRGVYIGRQILFGIIALQILNLSVGGPMSWDALTYDYSCAYNKTFDPTETAVEWIIEMNYGQQPGFSYNLHAGTTKCITKTMHWKTDLQKTGPEMVILPRPLEPRLERPVSRILSHLQETFSPPPETALA